jgi:hypothetical protein
MGNAVVAITVAPDGARAVVSLDRAVTRFDFSQGDVAWDGYAELLTSGLTLKGRTVEGLGPFRRFEIRVRPSREEHDGQYPAFYRLGDGGILYVPALVADPARWRSRIRIATSPAQVRYPSAGASEGFVFVGPPRLVSARRETVVVSDPAMPRWLADAARADLEAAVRAYEAALHMPLPTRPLLLLKYEAGERSFNVGDVTPGPMVALRFHGDAWNRPDPLAAEGIRTFILHEAFHFWNGALARPADSTPTWLHEGGAEYASLIAGTGAGATAEAAARARLGEALNRCRFGLQDQGDKALSQLGFLSNAVRYPCGMVLQWAVDLRVRGLGKGRSVLDVWADTIRAARRRGGGTYALADFYASAGIRGTATLAPAALLVDRSGPGRWAELVEALNALGAEVGQEVTGPARRSAMLFHLLRQSCTALPPDAGFGFYTETDRIRLQTPQGCGVVAGDPVLKTVEDADPFAATAETYAAVQRRCAAGEPVRMTTEDGRRLQVPCTKPLAPPVPDFVVRRWLPAAHSPTSFQANRSPAWNGTSGPARVSIAAGTSAGDRSSVTVPSLSGRP